MRLKGPEERVAELLTLLNIPRDRQRGTLCFAVTSARPTVSRIMLSGSVRGWHRLGRTGSPDPVR